jgi:hypothetical protein
MKRLLGVFIATAAALTLMLGVAAQAASADPAQVTKATLPSGFIDANGIFYPATCDETQVIADGQRKESFTCTFDAAVPPPFQCATASVCGWASDFDGALAVRAEVVITPSGLMVGSASY